jgi:Zn-finger in ubiquitin-hydrolases and other protein
MTDLSCGQVACSDSSKGTHGTKHFVNTTHPLIAALHDKPWKWCYVHKIYGQNANETKYFLFFIITGWVFMLVNESRSVNIVEI